MRPATRLAYVVRRPRLVARLRDRFDHRLTLLTGPGGAGKTTTLGLAIDDNRLDPFGVDVWFPAGEHDADARHLVGGLATALGAFAEGTTEQVTAAIVDAVWARAPTEVVLVIDDVHLLATDAATEVLDRLVRDLPRNGHVLLAGRELPAIAHSRLRALGHVLEITPDELAFDDDELADLIRSRLTANQQERVRADELSRFPALADLHLRAGPRAGRAFLWEEVLASLPPSRRLALARASVVTVVDDDLAALMSDGELTAAGLVAGLPLVERLDDGSFRLHAILREALRERTAEAVLTDAACVAAERCVDRGHLRSAVELYMEAGDEQQAIAAARRFAILPGLRRTFQDHLVVRNLVERVAPGTALAELLRVESQFGQLSTTTDVTRIGAGLVAASARAREEGDAELEAVALYRALVWISLDTAVPTELVDRLGDLAEAVPLAGQAHRYVCAELAMFAGEPERSIELLDRGPVVDPELDLVDRAGLLCSLGRPEEVGVGLTTADLAGMPDGAELYVGFALWTRGQLTPEVALPIALAMTAQTLARRIVHPIVAILGVTTFMALASGDRDTAARHVERARDEAAFGCSAHLRAFTAMSAAALAVESEGEGVATGLLDAMLAEIPMGDWPIRGYLLGLPMIYLLCPETRPTLDRCRFGAALTTARDAGRALVAAREREAFADAASLPWGQRACVRAHVLPVHLCELALAAIAGGNQDAAEVLSSLPDERACLRRVAEVASGAVATAARRRLDALPPSPRHRLQVDVLGGLRLSRDDVPVHDATWTRRARVRELMAVMVEERRVSRARAATALWPELDADAAQRNLRVTLTYLQKVIEPDRRRGEPPSMLRVVGDDLVLDESVVVDADLFDADMRRAIEYDRAGAPGSALELYRSALARFGGDYLGEIVGDWSGPTRQRLHVMAVGGLLRAGELELASGEPDRAADWAARAESLSPGNERAARLRAACLTAVGDRRAAAGVLRDAIAVLEADGLRPEPETRRLLDRLAEPA